MDILMNDNYEYLIYTEALQQAYTESCILEQMNTSVLTEGIAKTGWKSFTSFLTYCKERIIAFFDYMKKLIIKVKNNFKSDYIFKKALKMDLSKKSVTMYDLGDRIDIVRNVNDTLNDGIHISFVNISTLYDNSIAILNYIDPGKVYHKTFTGMNGVKDYSDNNHSKFNIALAKLKVNDENEMKEDLTDIEDIKFETLCTNDVINEIRNYDIKLSNIIDKLENKLSRSQKLLSKLSRTEKINSVALDGKIDTKEFENYKEYMNSLLKDVETYRKYITALLSAVVSLRQSNIKSLASLVKGGNKDGAEN